ncbi:MAG: restriction endonuclease subunit S [Burkholderiaceae bacterium]
MRLPTSWRQVALPQITEIVGGGTPERSNPNFFGGDIPWITPSDVTQLDGMWIYSTQERLTAEGLQKSPAKIVPKGTVLMATRVAVGRAAVAGVDIATNQDFVSLIIDSALINSEYLARAIEALSIFLVSRSQGSTIKGIPRATVERLQIPLPTLPEQQRIVELLRQAESFGRSRSSTQATLDSLLREHYAAVFGDAMGSEKGWPLRKISQVAELVRGSSPRPQGDPRFFGGPVPRLMVSDLTRDGLWVSATTDSLTVAGAKLSRPMPAQSVVMAVSGAPGLTAILNHDACIHDGFVGLRNLSADLLPEFVAFTLNLLRAKNDQQAVGAVFRNLTTDQVKAMTIPVPPIDLQQKFRTLLLQWQAVQLDIAKSKRQLSELKNALTIDAFSGDLTAAWRQTFPALIAEGEQSRAALLRDRGGETNLAAEVVAKSIGETNHAVRPARHWLLSELSDFQRQVLAAFTTYCHASGEPLLAEDADVFARFCDDAEVTERLQAFGNSQGNRIRRTLSQLAALGLIAKVTLPKIDQETGERDYLKAFRPLREDEFTRLGDVQALRSAFAPDKGEENS